MKDEEMAEEWFNKELYLESSMNNLQIEYYCRQAFLAGLKAGRPQWHYVKDGDLPKKTDEYLVYKISGYGCKSIELIQYNSSRHFWCVNCQNDVIAWKEIVLPKEIEK